MLTRRCERCFSNLFAKYLMASQAIGGVIAVVEDPMVASFLSTILRRKGYRVLPLETDECLKLLRSGNSGIGVLVTNAPAPFQEFAKTLPLLYLSSYPELKATSPFRICRVLRKPFHPQQLLAFVDELLAPM